jgi:hypothetical protein
VRLGEAAVILVRGEDACRLAELVLGLLGQPVDERHPAEDQPAHRGVAGCAHVEVQRARLGEELRGLGEAALHPAQ